MMESSGLLLMCVVVGLRCRRRHTSHLATLFAINTPIRAHPLVGPSRHGYLTAS